MKKYIMAIVMMCLFLVGCSSNQEVSDTNQGFSLKSVGFVVHKGTTLDVSPEQYVDATKEVLDTLVFDFSKVNTSEEGFYEVSVSDGTTCETFCISVKEPVNNKDVRVLAATSIPNMNFVNVTCRETGSLTIYWDALEGMEGYQLWSSREQNSGFVQTQLTRDTQFTYYMLGSTSPTYFKVRGYWFDENGTKLYTEFSNTAGQIPTPDYNVDATKVEEPNVEEPKVEEPKVEEPKVEEPKVEETKVEEPKVEEPKVEEPKVEETKVEEPKVEEPKVEEPKVEELKVETLNLNIANTNDSELTLSWNDINAECYKIYYSMNGQALQQIAIVRDKTEITFGWLPDGQYTYQIKAYHDLNGTMIGVSNLATYELKKVITVPEVSKPSIEEPKVEESKVEEPKMDKLCLNVANNKERTLTLTWNDIDAKYYKIYSSINNQPLKQIAIVKNETEITFGWLPDAQYTYQIKAYHDLNGSLVCASNLATYELKRVVETKPEEESLDTDEPEVDMPQGTEENSVEAMIEYTFTECNNIRIASGQDTVVMNETLTKMAQYRAEHLVKYDYFSHYYNGKSQLESVRDLFHYSTMSYLGENLGTICDYPSAPDVLMDAWVASSGHYENLINPAFTQTGIGVAFYSDGRFAVVHLFSN